MIRVGEAWLRAADISHMRWDRGHSYTKLLITMRDGTTFEEKDRYGSAYDAEREILAGIAADEQRSNA